MNWSQISEEIPLSLIIMSHRKWDGGEDRMVEKDGGFQTSVTDARGSILLLEHINQILSNLIGAKLDPYGL